MKRINQRKRLIFTLKVKTAFLNSGTAVLIVEDMHACFLLRVLIGSNVVSFPPKEVATTEEPTTDVKLTQEGTGVGRRKLQRKLHKIKIKLQRRINHHSSDIFS